MTELILARDPTKALSFNYEPRVQFLPYHNRTQRYACIIAHRRAGKSYALLNDMIVRALTMRPDGLRQQFALMAPTQTQARSIAWQYLRDQTACFAGAKGYKALEQHLTITLPDPRNTNKPGSTIMLVGAENAERLRGLFLDGIVIDEAADVADFIINQIIRPALADRLGWLTVSGTVKSIDDYLWRTHLLAEKMPLMWYSDLLSADKTGIIPQHELDDLRASMSEEAFQVEFLCNVNAATTGKIFLPYMDHKKTMKVPYDPAGAAPITAWDLGMSDSTAIWIMQMCGKEPHILDFYQNSGKSLDHYVDWLAKLEYSKRLGAHLLPHDSKVRELGSGKTRIQILREMGLRNIKVVTKMPKDQQIEAARLLLPKCYFNEDTTEEGRKALRNYSFSFDPKRKIFSTSPLHDQYSNGCLVAGTMIETSRGHVPIESIKTGDKVVTPSGYGLVTNSGATKYATELVTMTLADGRKLIGTPEHKIFVERKGLVTFANLSEGDIILEGRSALWRLFYAGARKVFLRLHALAAKR
jgi:hypothetical protein